METDVKIIKEKLLLKYNIFYISQILCISVRQTKRILNGETDIKLSQLLKLNKLLQS